VPSDLGRLNLNGRDFEELTAITSEADRLSDIMSASARIGPLVGIKAVAEAISEPVGMQQEDLRLILAGLLHIHYTRTKLKLDSHAAVELIGHNLNRLAKSPEDKKLVDNWNRTKKKIAAAISQLSTDHPLEGASKAFRVVASRQYDFVSMKVFTDVRPVFNEAGDKIVQSVIAHTLSIDYHDGQDHHVIQFTLDAEEIAGLKKECERAELKGSVLKRDLKQLSWPTSVFHEPAKSAEQNGEGSS